MLINQVLKYFSDNYPNLPLTKLPADNPSEIICEIDPTSAHPAYSMAVVAISSSAPHYHRNAEEEYEVLSGTLLVRIGEIVKTVYEHEKVIIPVGKVHSATSVEGFAMVAVESSPGWRQEDHVTV